MSLQYALRTVKSIWPLVKGAVLRGQMFRPRCELTPPHADILCEYNVPVPIADGVTLTANVFRSHAAQAASTRLPVLMCAHPYNNQLLPALGKTPLGGAPIQYRIIPQAGRPRFSTLTSWESPDPNFWVPAGYAVVNLNLPGFGTSGGRATVFTNAQAKAYYEAIEWAAKQSWSSGRVGLSGVSYLAISQYHVAACQHYGGPPPSLRCISPWEGFADIYREVACPGGIEDQGFGPFWWATEVKPSLNRSVADFIELNGGLPADFLKVHPLYDDFWREKAAKLEQITLPMLVCASFSDHDLHTTGSFRAFMRSKSSQKWLYTHRGGKWDVYYSPEAQQLIKEFMDCFLKEEPHGFLQRAPVRLEVRSSRDVIHEVRGEHEWPLARTQYTKLHLAADARKLSWNESPVSQAVEYPGNHGQASFVMQFDTAIELTGYMKLRLWVQTKAAPGEPSPPDDMAIFVAVHKRDSQGRIVPFRGAAGHDHNPVTRGFCRVSRRELDEAESTAYRPVLTGTSRWPLKPNEIVPVEIALYPSSTFFAAGNSLELIVAAREIVAMPPFSKDVGPQRGVHVLHCGGEHDSHLLLPVIPGKGADGQAAVNLL